MLHERTERTTHKMAELTVVTDLIHYLQITSYSENYDCNPVSHLPKSDIPCLLYRSISDFYQKREYSNLHEMLTMLEQTAALGRSPKFGMTFGSPLFSD